MAERNKLTVIDASIVLAWLLPDERFMKAANALLARSITNEVSFTAPMIIRYEVLNAIRSAFLRKRINKRQVKKAVDQFVKLDIRLENQTGKEEEIIDIAITAGLSVYDACYVELAKTLQADFYTTDQTLARKASSCVTVRML